MVSVCVKAMLQSPSSPVGLRKGVGRTVLCTKELYSTLQVTFIVDKFPTCVSPQSLVAGSVARAKLKPKTSCWQDRKPNIFTQGLCVPGPGSLALGSSHFPFSCSRRKRDGTRDQGVNTPKVGNGELALILTWLYIQLPCAGKPATHTANWDTWRRIKQNHCTGLLLSVDAATLLWPEPHRIPTRDNMLLWNTDVGEASAQPNSFVFQFVCY